MAADPLIRVTGLRKAFAGHVVLADVRLEVRAGEAVALLGANGAGKTTLLRILATLTRPSRGTAFVLGHDCARAPERVRPHIGLVAHGAYVYEDLTALENLRFWTALSGLAADGAVLARALAAVELERFAGERVRTFSAGMKRRLSLARFVLSRPRVLLLDEPFAALPGILWLGFVLAGLLGLGRTFVLERENDCWDALLLAPGDKSAIYVGKLAGNVLLMLVVETLLLVLFTFFFNVDLAGALPALAFVVALGTLGLAAVGTLFAAMTAQVRARELLFPVLLLPVQVPVLLATVKATEAVLLGEPLGAVGHWLGLLAAADVIYIVTGLLTFDFLLES